MRKSLISLLEEVSCLTDLQQRKVGCLVGAAVGDAAARPLHWIYDLNTLNQVVSSNPEYPEFWPESKSPFYSLPTGENSCYWDQCQAVMTAVVQMDKFSLDVVKRELCSQFGEGGEYNSENREEYMKLRRFGVVQGPIDGKWLHGSVARFMENHAKGKQVCGDPHIKETDGFCCSLPAVVRWAGNNSLEEIVNKVTTTQSTWPIAVKHAHVASKIIEAFILNKEDPINVVKQDIMKTHPEISEEIEEIQHNLNVPHIEAVGKLFGRPCYNPGSFMGAIHGVLTSDSLQEAVRKTILAGGCNCSRAFFIGAMMGARDGVSGIPDSWLERTNNSETILKLAIKLAKL